MTNSLTIESVKNIIIESDYKSSLKKKLYFSDPSISKLLDYEVIPVFDNKKSGFLLLQVGDAEEYIAVRFESIKMKANSTTGRRTPVICDLCFTWQSGQSISRITFYSSKKNGNSVSLLCCGNLICSLHVRKLTETSVESQSQLRESLDEASRIKRLRTHYSALI
jgi:hypothetical protein